MAEYEDIAQIVSVISAAFPLTFNPTELTVETYFQMLQDVPADELKAATLHCIGELGRKFGPSVGEIRGMVAELRKLISNTPSSYEAWQEVIEQMQINGGDFGKPVWTHPLVERAVRILGWRNLRLSEDMTADRARFIGAYEQLLTRSTNEEMMLPEVRGYIESKGGVLRLAPASQIKLLADKLGAGRK